MSKKAADVFQRLVDIKLGYANPDSMERQEIMSHLSRNPRVPLDVLDTYKNHQGIDFTAISKNYTLTLHYVLQNVEKNWDFEKLAENANISPTTLFQNNIFWGTKESIWRRTDITIEQLLHFSQSGQIKNPIQWIILSERPDFSNYVMIHWSNIDNISCASCIPFWVEFNWVAMTVNMPFIFIIEHVSWPWIWSLLYLNHSFRFIHDDIIINYFQDKPDLKYWLLQEHDIINTRNKYYTKRYFENFIEKGYSEYMAFTNNREASYLSDIFTHIPHEEIPWPTIFTYPTKPWNIPLLLQHSQWEVNILSLDIYLKGHPNLTLHSFLLTFCDKLNKLWQMNAQKKVEMLVLERLYVPDDTNKNIEDISNALQRINL